MDVLSSHYIVLQNAPESSWIKPIGSSDTIRYSGNDRFSKRPEVMPPSLDRFEFIDRAIRSFFFLCHSLQTCFGTYFFSESILFVSDQWEVSENSCDARGTRRNLNRYVFRNSNVTLWTFVSLTLIANLIFFLFCYSVYVPKILL